MAIGDTYEEKFDIVDFLFIGIAYSQRFILFASLFQRELRSLFKIFFIFDHCPNAECFILAGFAIYRHTTINFFIVMELFGRSGKSRFNRLKMTPRDTPFSFETASATINISLLIIIV